jgi:1-acyl-sn-glycerol-3-phosphate acyltransferase
MEHLPASGPVILAGNHINKTGLDAMLVGSKIFAERGSLPKFVTVANPTGRILRHFLRMMGKNDGVLLPIREGKTTDAMIQFLQNPGAFNRQQPILGIFPAGRADRDFAKHMSGEWHTSAAVTAIETGAPIVPFFVEGLPYIWEPFDMLKAVARAVYGKAFEFKVRFGPPIRVAGMGRDYKAIIEQVRQAVLHLGAAGEQSAHPSSPQSLESSASAAVRS